MSGEEFEFKESKTFELGGKTLFALDEIARIYELPSRDSALQFALGAALIFGYEKEGGWKSAVTKDGATRQLDLIPARDPKAPGGGPVRDGRLPAPQIA
jgi:hypothetical protein